MGKRGRGARDSRLATLVKVCGIVLVSICFMASAMIIYSDTEGVEEVWAKKERTWRLEEEKWAMETNALQDTLERLELVMGYRSIDPRKVSMLPYSEDPRHAIVTTFGGNHDHPEFTHALALCKSLREVDTRVANIVAIFFGEAELPLLIQRAFRSLNVEVIHKHPPRVPPSTAWGHIWARFKVWSLSEYSRILYMDSRSIAVDNLDHLLDLNDPADHKGDSELIMHTALRQPACEFWEPCSARTFPSHRMFMIKPDDALADLVEGRILSKSDEIALADCLSLISDKISYTPFPGDKYDIPFGECSCRGFKNMKSYTLDCLQVQDVWSDVLGRLFVERGCTHDLMVTWLRLFVSTIERLDR
mmetsp:Transcript_1710/g.6083  ORF Transcript_1710/g.6083 Transcript_1710/m.6083 type:complete len:361 (-) Transcript_1710:40-1122(-)|eukprot:CAMPEP_0114612454 /NCGR_PEP_ID=MMETSP0168-20121206/4631_1 /TAXON_ID=95228 ORGANISM="Vannella sp., Strain DIVA3 517/6/12" /NCGR_SAMPLE_ID=MMETSP0168 /ASSEMBLY_ACC=CAM_ASM_000044 /LENGTH=360 /DNA_ID=CAMNT_0001823441 /DNA_START=64 /DNA_END=1146 /DNA_ORIENTATION=+